jgi:5-methylcytosine-specific restriction endonuclease McrA
VAKSIGLDENILSSRSKKDALLGMPTGTAWGRLRKEVLFSLAKKLCLTRCHRCDQEIETVSQLSIDHKIDWQSSDTPLETFMDIDNIAFSHLSCNVSAASRPTKKYHSTRERNRENFRIYYERNGAEWNERRNARRRKPTLVANDNQSQAALVG